MDSDEITPLLRIERPERAFRTKESGSSTEEDQARDTIKQTLSLQDTSSGCATSGAESFGSVPDSFSGSSPGEYHSDTTCNKNHESTASEVPDDTTARRDEKAKEIDRATHGETPEET